MNRILAGRLACAAAALLLVLLAARLALAGFPVQTGYPWSAGVLLDGGARVLTGQVPHSDFHTPIGPAYLAAVAGCLRLADGQPHALALLAALAGCATGAVALALAWRRFPRAMAGLLALGVGLLATSPAFFGPGSLDLSFGGHYSRTAWSLLAVVILWALAPAREPAKRWIPGVEAVIAGLCLGAAAGTKFTFALVGVALLLVAWWYGRASLRSLALAAAGAAAAVGLALAISGASPIDYLRDCAGVGGNASLLRLLIDYRRSLDPLGLALLAAVAVLTWRAHSAAWRPTLLRPLPAGPALALACLAGGIALSATNGIEHASPCYLLAAIVLVARTHDRQEGEADPSARAALLITAAALLATCARLAMPIATGPYAAKAPARLAAGGPWTGLGFMPADEPRTSRAELYPYLSREPRTVLTNAWFLWLDAGATLLDGRVAPGEHVLCLDFVNPFPYVLERPAPVGDHLYWHFGRNVGPRNTPSPEALLGGAEWVMVPKIPLFADTARRKRSLYDPYIAEHCRLVAENDWWWCWRRTPNP